MDIICIVLPGIWAGLLMGVSFVATPAKFCAASLSLPVALDIGRATFAIWNNVEWLLLAMATFAILEAKAGVFSMAAAGALNLLLLIQSMILLPSLNKRATTIIGGGRPNPSFDHATYIATDFLKLCILTAIIWKQSAFITSLGVRLH